MKRDEAIKTIEGLLPADSEYPDTANLGKKFLEQAKNEINNWRDQPTNVLIRYAQLCSEYDESIFKNRTS